MYKINKLKKVLGRNLQEHVNIKNFTTIKVGGVADYYYKAKTIEDLVAAVICAREDKIPYFILGGGSNIIVSDYGFGGIIIHNQTSNISILPDKSQIIADSGVNLNSLILKSVGYGIGGLEPLYGIYGTIGGAVYGNAGAYQVEIFDFVKNVTMLTPNNKLVNKNKTWFEADYRSTKLKRNKVKDYIILTVKLQLAKNKKEKLLENIAYYKQQRDKKFATLGFSAGSIFKNPSSGKKYQDPELAKINSAGYILEEIGAKNMSIGDARIFNKHANIIENKGKASAQEIRNLIEILKEEVSQKKGVKLEEEIEYIGQWQ